MAKCARHDASEREKEKLPDNFDSGRNCAPFFWNSRNRRLCQVVSKKRNSCLDQSIDYDCDRGVIGVFYYVNSYLIVDFRLITSLSTGSSDARREKKSKKNIPWNSLKTFFFVDSPISQLDFDQMHFSESFDVIEDIWLTVNYLKNSFNWSQKKNHRHHLTITNCSSLVSQCSDVCRHKLFFRLFFLFR